MLPTFVIACAVLSVAVVALAIIHLRTRRKWKSEREAMCEQHKEDFRAFESERYAILNALSDAFLLIDFDGYIRFANTQATALFPRREILDRSIGDILLDRRFSKPIRKALKKRTRITKEVFLPQHSSHQVVEDVHGESSWLVDAGPIGSELSTNLIRVIIRNTTSEHHADQIRKDFVANASHELRTPLAIINGYLENLVDEDLVEDPGTARRFLTIMRKHADRIARIVEDMLLISRLESGEASSLRLKPFDFGACVQDVLERLESMIAAKHTVVNVQAADPTLVVVGDRFYWTQVLFNLVENALKQNPEIPLEITIGQERLDDGGARIWVSDNGVGIPSADLPFIFRRFYRVEKHHSQGEIKGTGLGLSIVKRAVEAHGGSISVSSIPGNETRFEITLPPETVAPLEELHRQEPTIEQQEAETAPRPQKASTG